MRHIRLQVTTTLLGLFCAIVAHAQQSQPATTTADPTVTPGPIIGGMGTKNFIPLWATPNFLLSSVIFQSAGGNVGIGTQAPGSRLDVAGDINLTGNLSWYGLTVLPLSQIANGNLGFGTALASDTPDAIFNTGIGIAALFNNTSGYGNTATGYHALVTNSTGGNNTASGLSTLADNTTGSANTAIGSSALPRNTTGNNNIAIGWQAASNVSSGNSNNIHIGHGGSSSDSGTIRIGTPGVQTSFFVAGVRGVTTANHDAIPVMIDSAGQLGTVSSSRRFKEDISDMGAASRDLMRLRPVTFRYKQPFADASKPIQYGLIAEEVAEVYPDLVAHSADGQIETVKYQVLDSMLLNEVQRQQAEIRSLQQQINELKTALASVSSARISNVQ